MKKIYSPRVQIKMNTGTRVIRTKIDKENTRQRLNKKAKELDL